MSELSSSNWSESAGSNNAAPPNGWPEGMAPSAVNDAAREMMAVLKRFWNRVNPSAASGGAANAYTLTPTSALAAYVTGEVYSFRANFTNTGSVTLNISGLGAKTLKKYTPSGKIVLAPGDIQSGMPVQLVYDGTDLILTSQAANNGGWELLSTQTASNSATLDFTSVITSVYDTYRLDLVNITPASDAALWLRTSTDNGANYDASAGNYGWGIFGIVVGGTDGNLQSSADTKIIIAGGLLGDIEATSAPGLSGWVEFSAPSAVKQLIVRYDVAYANSSGNFAVAKGAGRRVAAADVDAVRLLMSTGNIASGVARLYGLRK